MELMASHDFQTALHNYLDLEDLRSRLQTWKTSLDAFDEMTRLRAAHYEPLLPEIDAQFRELDARMRLRLEQRTHLRKQLQAMLTAPRPEHLATAEERVALERLAALERQLGDADTPQTKTVRARIARLRGALTWRLETEYQDRLTAAHVHLKELDTQVEALTKQYDAFVRTRQAATHSYVGYDVQISRLRERVGEAAQQVDTLMARQGHMIETVAVNQLEARRTRLVAQQTEARYGVADSYDRAARAQASTEAR
jgi:chromosome segregation ATPase